MIVVVTRLFLCLLETSANGKPEPYECGEINFFILSQNLKINIPHELWLICTFRNFSTMSTTYIIIYRGEYPAFMYPCRIMHDVTYLNCIMSDISNQLHSVASVLNLSFNYKLP